MTNALPPSSGQQGPYPCRGTCGTHHPMSGALVRAARSSNGVILASRGPQTGRLSGSPRASHPTTTSFPHRYPFAVHAHVHRHAFKFALYHTTHSTAVHCSEPPQTTHHIITSFPLPTLPSHTRAFRTKEGGEALGTSIVATQGSVKLHRRELPPEVHE